MQLKPKQYSNQLHGALPTCEYSTHKNVAYVPHLQQDTVQVTSHMMDRRPVSLHSTNNTAHPFNTDARISIQMTQ